MCTYIYVYITHLDSYIKELYIEGIIPYCLLHDGVSLVLRLHERLV